jgi:hypothetical protein
MLLTENDISEKQFQTIEDMAATGFIPEQIAEVLEMSEGQFMDLYRNRCSLVYKRYRKGFLEAEYKLRVRIFKDAGNGSSPAQTLAKKILDECAYKNPMNE